jgi:ElaB/YqjD/DUF883 family membrane-anchored ribosome-binding protein
MDTQHVKEEVDRTVARLQTLRDEVKVRLHLASLDAQKEWDEVLSPKIFELEQTAKQVGEPARAKAKELIERVEAFLGRLRQ